jgi:soluble lytic murein transglycosylase-like protein
LNGSIKPLQGKENYITWSIEIENVLLRNNNAAYIRNGSRAVRLGTRYLDDYNRQLEQYNQDLKAYNAAAAAGRGRVPARPALPKKPDEAKGEEKELKI